MISHQHLEILLCDDEPFIRTEVPTFMKRYFPEVHARYMLCTSIEDVQRQIDKQEFRCDIAITDVNLEKTGGGPDDGLEILLRLKKKDPDIEVILVTRYEYGSENVAVAHRHGMCDWVKIGSLEEEDIANICPRCGKEIEYSQLEHLFPECVTCSTPLRKVWLRLQESMVRILKLLDAKRALYQERENRAFYQKKEVEANIVKFSQVDLTRFEVPRENIFYGIVFCSKAMRDAIDAMRLVAPSAHCVLIRGETGTGKELVAHAISRLRAHQGLSALFVPVNCAAMPKDTVESELFGHEKGAFTGATAEKTGMFEHAGTGVLFLDELGEMPLDLQPKLLRVLDGHPFTRVGGHTEIQPKCKVVCATSKDLEAMVRQHSFYPELLHRVDDLRVLIPPLWERTEEIPLLCCHLIAKQNEELGRSVKHIDDNALLALSTFDWPGNVRHLEKVLTRIVLTARGDTVTLADVEKELSNHKDTRVSETERNPEVIWEQILSGSMSKSLPDLVKEFGTPATIDVVKLAVKHFGGRFPPDPMCQRLFGGMGYRAFQQWLRRRGITTKDFN